VGQEKGERMSMLSAQCDELRAMAESVGLTMPQAATLMMSAADTILELRDDLQRANDAVQDAEHDESCAWDRVQKAEYENAKLRELVRELWDWLAPAAVGGGAPLKGLYDRMRDLGIEVD